MKLPIVVVGCLVPTVHAAITLSPNSLLLADRSGTRLRHVDLSGNQLGSVQLPVDANRTLEGLALVGSDAFVCFASSTQPGLRQVAQVNLQTGALSNVFGANNPVGLATRDGTLVVLGGGAATTTPSVQRFSTTGTLLSTITLTGGALGFNEFVDDIAWDGSQLWTISNFRGPSTGGSFAIDSWNPQTGAYTPPSFISFYPQANMLAEGYDIAGDGSAWYAINPRMSNANTTAAISGVFSNGQAINLTVQGAISDLVYIVPAPGSILVPACLALCAATRRRTRRGIR